MNKKELASQRTKETLKHTFLELYAKNGMSGVTVGAITRKAGYNRTTFYNYYNDLDEMLAEIEDDVLSKIRERMSVQELQINNMDDAFEQFLSFFEAYGDIIYILLSKSGSSEFRNRFKETAFSIYRKIFADKFSDEQIEYLISFVSSAGLGLIEHWYETGKKYPIDEFVKVVQGLISIGVMGYMQSPLAVQGSPQR